MQSGIKMIEFPKNGQYPDYFRSYVELVQDKDVLKYLLKQKESFLTFMNDQVKPNRTLSYEIGKWTCQEVFGHLIDTERILLNRAFFIARSDGQNLPGFEQDDYVSAGNFMKRDFDDMLNEFSLARENSLQLLNSFDDSDYKKTGLINGYSTILTAIPYIMGGHIAHHEYILRSKYLK